MRAAPCERVQVKRQSGDQSFAFAGRHFCNAASVQNDPPEQLNIEVHHVPHHRLIAHCERVLPLFQPARCVFTTANASGKISSSFFHWSCSSGIFEISSFQAAVFARSSSSDKPLNCSSSSLIRRTIGDSRLSSR